MRVEIGQTSQGLDFISVGRLVGLEPADLSTMGSCSSKKALTVAEVREQGFALDDVRIKEWSSSLRNTLAWLLNFVSGAITAPFLGPIGEPAFLAARVLYGIFGILSILLFSPSIKTSSSKSIETKGGWFQPTLNEETISTDPATVAQVLFFWRAILVVRICQTISFIVLFSSYFALRGPVVGDPSEPAMITGLLWNILFLLITVYMFYRPDIETDAWITTVHRDKNGNYTNEWTREKVTSGYTSDGIPIDYSKS